MSIATAEIDSVTNDDETAGYKALHSGAVFGLVFAVFAAAFTLFASGSTPEVIYVSLLNAPALLICLWSIGKIRRAPELYTGHVIALLGAILSAVALLVGTSYGTYVYINEVPDGYTRVSFNGMKPDELQERSNVTVPPEIAALEGKKVFIKGYIRQDSITVPRGIKRFLLVRDNQQCCFGDISKVKYYDQIDVELTGDKLVDYTPGVFRIGGTLHVEPQNVAFGSRIPVFSMTADYATN